MLKRHIHSTSPTSFDEIEPLPKRARLFVSSPTPPPEDILIDEPLIPSVTITEESPSEYDEDDDDAEIIEIERQKHFRESRLMDNAIIFLSDSESDDDDDQGIDVTDDIPPSLSSPSTEFIASPSIEDVEILADDVDVELTAMEEEETNDEESLEIITDDAESETNDELIDLTDDEPLSLCSSLIASERKPSTDVQQCPICLETLSHLQCSGIYLTITRCRHVMCTLCSRALLATSSRCPLCRESVSSTTLMPYCILT